MPNSGKQVEALSAMVTIDASRIRLTSYRIALRPDAITLANAL